MNIPFDWQPTTRVCFGAGTLRQLGQIAADLGGRRVLVVSDPGIVRAGHVDRGLAALHAAGLQTTLYDGVAENPTTRHVDEAVAVARDAQVDLLVGLGGGSSMDTAKGANFLLTNGGKMADYWGVGKATQPMLPMIAVPTTAGTGSEAQSFALISDEQTHVKMACGDKKAACRVAILDPELTVSQPPLVTAVSGIDALSHAVESYVTRKRTPLSCMLAREAFRMLVSGFPRVLSSPENLEARAEVLLGAHLAGAAIENSMLGATHSAANPLTARYGTTHGVAIGVMLPHVVRFNGQLVGEEYAELTSAVGLPASANTAPYVLAGFLTRLVEQAGLPTRLPGSVEVSHIPELAAQAEKQWTAQFNPRPISSGDFAQLYTAALADPRAFDRLEPF